MDWFENILEELERESFDDSSIKELVKEYKDDIEKIDDCTFVEILDSLKESFDIKKFDKLLNTEKFNEHDAWEVNFYIILSKEIIKEHLKDKITTLTKLYNKFSR